MLNNYGYGAMRSFSRAVGITHSPGIAIHGLDFPALAAGHGCRGLRVEGVSERTSALPQTLGE